MKTETVALLPCLNRLEVEKERLGDLLRSDYLDYIANVSNEAMAVSYQTACLLLLACEERAPKRILDLGSGFSSLALHRWAQENDALCVSVDNDPKWIEATRAFLGDRGITDPTVLEFRQPWQGEYDLIFDDLAAAEHLRKDSLAAVLDCLAPDGVLILDDVHKKPLRDVAEQIAAHGPFAYHSMRDWTVDNFGRYAGLLVRDGR